MGELVHVTTCFMIESGPAVIATSWVGAGDSLLVGFAKLLSIRLDNNGFGKGQGPDPSRSRAG